MNKDYQTLHPLHVEDYGFDEMAYETGPYVPYKKEGAVYCAGGFPYLTPLWYTDWRDETLAWHYTCALYAHLNPSPLTIIRGPEAKKFLKENFVNNLDNFPIGIIKHGLICLENGLLATHGMLLHTAENQYEAYWHAPYIDYLFEQKKYDAELIDASERQYLFQLQGPRSLEIVEEVTGENLHDLEYRHYRDSKIDGNTVRILRFSMSGALGYEIHGEIQYAMTVYKKLMEIGAKYGMRLMGDVAYCMTNTPAGITQAGGDFQAATFMDEGFQRWKQAREGGADDGICDYDDMAVMDFLGGSVGQDISKHVFDPFECGLGHCVNLKHEFRGRAALQQRKENQTRKLVTLEWNPEDLTEIYASQFKQGEPYKPLDYPGGESSILGYFVSNMDYVLAPNGDKIGVAFGRVHSAFYKVMLSMASIDLAYTEEGTQVHVLWGEPGTRQKLIRATVVHTPYNRDRTNDVFDVGAIPCPLHMKGDK